MFKKNRQAPQEQLIEKNELFFLCEPTCFQEFVEKIILSKLK